MIFGKVLATMVGVAFLVPAATAQVVASKDVKPAKEPKTCRSMMPTGSIMSTRVCNTAAAWKTFDGTTSDGADQFRAVYRMSSTGKLPK